LFPRRKMATYTARFHFKQNGDASNFYQVFKKCSSYAYSPPFFSEQDPQTKFCIVLSVFDYQVSFAYLQFASEMFYGENSCVPTQEMTISAKLSFYQPDSMNGFSFQKTGKFFM